MNDERLEQELRAALMRDDPGPVRNELRLRISAVPDEVVLRRGFIRSPSLHRLLTLAAAVAAVAIVGSAMFIALSLRGPAVGPASPSSSASAVPSVRPSATPTTLQSASGPALAEHESILQMHRTAAGGWLLTGSRLLVTDGASWRDCWRSTSGDLTSPYLHALVAGDVVRVISKTTMWTSTDGCASWAESALPIAPTGVAFPTESTGYVAVGDESGSNGAARIFRTDDAGQHWTATPGKVGTGGNLAFAFADADHGWLTDSQTLWATANGGSTWTKTTLPVPGSVHGKLDVIATPVVGVDGSAVVTAKYDTTPGMDGARGQQVFYRTVDRGAHWTAISIIDDPGMLTMSLVDPTTWVVLDPWAPQTSRATTDAGSTWQTISVRVPWPFNSGPIDFADSLHGWMVVSEPEPPCAPNTICDYLYGPPQHLVTTDDGGATWVELKP